MKSFHSTPRLSLFPPGYSVGLAIALCAALCQGTHSSDKRSDTDCVNKFRSALESEDLTAVVLQYAMCAGEAKAKLSSDPGLVRLYNKYTITYVEQPGVEVMGAGDAQVNGWYHRKERVEGPPRGRWARSLYITRAQQRTPQAGDTVFCHWRTRSQGKSSVFGTGTILQVNTETRTLDLRFDDGVRQSEIPYDWVVPDFRYEKDDGHFICRVVEAKQDCWWIRNPAAGCGSYYRNVPSGFSNLPPTLEWEQFGSCAPAPTLRVVN